LSKLCNALSGVYIGKGAMIIPATMTRARDTLVLALASLIEAAEIGSFLIDIYVISIYVATPKGAKTSTVM
jgi:hypothetical protein